MDGHRFDDLAKRLVTREISRRHLVRVLAGGVAGAALVVAGRAPAGAIICRQPGILCAKDAQCCSGSCDDDNRCACPDGLSRCGRDCVDFESDAQHCGSCDIACGGDAPCVSGTCCLAEYSCGSQCCGPDETCDTVHGNACVPATGCPNGETPCTSGDACRDGCCPYGSHAGCLESDGLCCHSDQYCLGAGYEVSCQTAEGVSCGEPYSALCYLVDEVCCTAPNGRGFCCESKHSGCCGDRCC